MTQDLLFQVNLLSYYSISIACFLFFSYILLSLILFLFLFEVASVWKKVLGQVYFQKKIVYQTHCFKWAVKTPDIFLVSYFH